MMSLDKAVTSRGRGRGMTQQCMMFLDEWMTSRRCAGDNATGGDVAGDDVTEMTS